jgi:hypothetical protein
LLQENVFEIEHVTIPETPPSRNTQPDEIGRFPIAPSYKQ